MSATDLVTPYREFFRIIVADSEPLLKRAFRLRYQVYCEELGWEDPGAHNDHEERDVFDASSIHCLLVHRPSGLDAGTVRLVRTWPGGPEPCLPLLAHYDPAGFLEGCHPALKPRGTFGEISRLALHERFRRRAGERETPDGHGVNLFQWGQDERRRFPHMALGLYLAAASIGLAEGMEGVYAMMEPRLARHLHFGGIYFEQIGAAVEFRGQRAPFYITRAALFERLPPPLFDLLAAIAEDLGLSLHEKAPLP